MFLLDTLYQYFIHRFAHWKHPYNVLYHIHRTHHQIPLNKLKEFDTVTIEDFYINSKNIWNLFDDFIFHSNLVLFYFYDPNITIILAIYSWLYERYAPEHDDEINNSIFAVGKFHMQHHKKTNKNYSVVLTVWDYVFGTVDTNF